MSVASLETPAWLMRGVITYDAKVGRLKLERGRLSFRETEGQSRGGGASSGKPR